MTCHVTTVTCLFIIQEIKEIKRKIKSRKIKRKENQNKI